jgi:hypothetical protein
MIAVRNRAAALVSTVLAIATATLALPAPASAVVPGVSVQITKLPATFTTGAKAGTVTAVASAVAGRRCQKVRWSLLLRLEGVNIDQVRVNRVEDEADFPLRIERNGDNARLTDVKFDPGSLCGGRTVTARYDIAFTGGEGKATFQVEAFDAATRLLQSGTGSSRVERPGKPAANPTPSASKSADPSPSASDDGDLAAVDDQESADASTPPAAVGDIAQSKTSGNGGTPSLLGPGLIIGAVLVFLGVGLLLRIRMRSNKAAREQRRAVPYYSAQENY